MDWEKAGVFISLVTPLFLGVGAWIVGAIAKKKEKKEAPKPEVVQGLPVDYETDYINLLKRNLRDAKQEIAELKQENKILRNRNGNPDKH